MDPGFRRGDGMEKENAAGRLRRFFVATSGLHTVY
jgi:hypothetical protein